MTTGRTISTPITRSQLARLAEEQFGDWIKAVVDVSRGVMAAGGVRFGGRAAPVLLRLRPCRPNAALQASVGNPRVGPMTRTRHAPAFLLLCALAGAGLIPAAGGVSAQVRAGDRAFALQAAIDEMRRSPFHASHGATAWAMTRDEVPDEEVRRPGSRTTTQVGDTAETRVQGGSIFFYSLPVVAVLDVLALAKVGDEGFDIDPLIALGAIAAPPLVAKLTGARTVFAVVGSALGFGSGALLAKAFDRFGLFLAPAVHAGATAVASILGDRTR